MSKRYFSREVKVEVVRRYLAGEGAVSLGAAYSVRPTLVHQWVGLYRRHGPGGLRDPGRPSRLALAAELTGSSGAEADAPSAADRRIALLERKLAQQALELDFFKHALRHFETSLPPAAGPGATAPAPSSGRKRNRKAG